jgi:D-sedoheptulose 7-phosphate isomerase
VLVDAAEALRSSFAHGGKVLALGNGGSATDAMDVVADLRAGGRPAIDLTEDPGILTAIANDIGVEAIFSRQVIAYGVPGDVLLALSTSGNSGNVIEALAEARRRGLATIALVGYDGGRVAGEELADHVVVTRSEHIPRIQEAQASAYHALVELTG